VISLKKKYVVYTTVYHYCTLDVEAESAEEAVDLVREMDEDEHNMKASLSSMEIGVDEDAFEWEEINNDPEIQIESEIADLQTQIRFNNEMLTNRDYDPINDDYWDVIMKRNERLQVQVDKLKRKKKGSY
jgi:hypothetical protein